MAERKAVAKKVCHVWFVLCVLAPTSCSLCVYVMQSSHYCTVCMQALKRIQELLKRKHPKLPNGAKKPTLAQQTTTKPKA